MEEMWELRVEGEDSEELGVNLFKMHCVHFSKKLFSFFFKEGICTADTGGFLSLGIWKPSAQSKALASLLLLGKCVVELL